MPELPDITVISKNLGRKLKGKKVVAVKVHATGRMHTSAAQFSKALVNAIITKINRTGKELHINFDNHHVLALHLMLFGELHLFKGEDPHKNAVISLLFNDDSGI